MTMKTAMLRCSTVALVVALVVLALPATAQPGPPPGRQGGLRRAGHGPAGHGAGDGRAHGAATDAHEPARDDDRYRIADGVVYVACQGTLTAYEAQTLKQLGQATFWTPPEPPPGGPMGPGGPQGPPPGGPPPAAP